MIVIAIATPESNDYRVQSFEGQIVAGRDAACNLVLTARGVSGTHCRFSPMQGLPGAYMLEDLGSKYGTFVNRERVSRPVVVSSRDVITVGGHELALAEPGHEHAAIGRLQALANPQPQPAPVAVAPPATGGPLPNFDPRAPWLQQFEYFDALARGWHERGRPNRQLLKGRAIAVAGQWLAAGARQSPAPDALHRDFIESSRNRRSARAQLLGLGIGAVGLAGGGALAWHFLGANLDDILKPPVAVVEPEQEDDKPKTAAQTVDLTDLVEESRAVEDPITRLLLQAALLETAAGQNLGTTSEAAWRLHASAHATLAKLRETVLRGHTEAVTAVAFAPVGNKLVSASDDGSARLWDLSSAGRPNTLRGHTGPVTALGFSADGHWLATGGEDGRVWRWDLSAKDPGGTGVVLKKHESAVRHIAWHPGGRFFVSGDDDGLLVVWDREAAAEAAEVVVRSAHDGPITALLFDTAVAPSLYSASDDRTARRWTLREDGGLAKRRTYDDHTGGLTALAVSGDQRWMATATTANELLLWRRAPATKKKKAKTELIPLLGHKDVVTRLSFTPDGHWLVTAGDDGNLHVWDLTASDPSVASVVLTGHTGEVTSLDVAVGGQRAVSGATDNSVRVWDLTKVQRVVDRVDLQGHNQAVESVSVSPDGLLIASGAQDKTVRVWDALGRSPGRGGTTLRVGPRPVLDVALSSSDRMVAVAEGRAVLWDLTRQDRRPEAVSLNGVTGIVNAAAFDPSGRWVAGAAEAGTISLWPIAGDGGGEPRVLTGHEGSVNAVAFTPDGATLLSVSSDRTLRAWPMSALESAAVWTAHQDEVHVLAVSPKGDFAFSGALDGGIVRWSLADGSSAALTGHEGEILQLRISGDGQTLASASADRRVRIWDVATGESRFVLRGHDEAVNAIAFSRNGLLASAGQDRTIRVWDLTSDHPDEAPKALVGHEQSVTDLLFIGDGGMLASSSNDATVRLWRLDTRDSIPLSGHDGVVTKLALTVNESALISASFDGSVTVWPLTAAALSRQICAAVGTGLAAEEGARFFGRDVRDPCAPAEK